MKKRSVELLIANIFASFFWVTLATYMFFVIRMLLEKMEKGDSFDEVLALGYSPALILFIGGVILFVAIIVGWTAFSVKKRLVTAACTVAYAIGNGALLVAAAVAYLESPPYAFVSLLLTAFFVPSTALACVATARFKEK